MDGLLNSSRDFWPHLKKLTIKELKDVTKIGFHPPRTFTVGLSSCKVLSVRTRNLPRFPLLNFSIIVYFTDLISFFCTPVVFTHFSFSVIRFKFLFLCYLQYHFGLFVFPSEKGNVEGVT